MVDITERRAAEEAWRRCEAVQLHSQVLMSMTEGVNFADAQGIIRFTNPAFDAMFGYEPGELIGQHVSVLNDLSAADNACFISGIMATVCSHGYWIGELSNRKKDGTAFMTATRISMLKGSSEVCFVTVQEDITWRKQAETALRDSESRFRAIFEQSPDGIVLLDPETTKAIQFNESACQALGYTAEEFAQLRECDYEISESSEEIAARMQKLMAQGAHRFETCHRGKDGRLRRILVNARVIELAARRLILAVFRDFTEQWQAENALRHSEARYRALLEALPDSLFRIRSDGTFLEYKPAKEFPAFKTSSEFLGKRISDVLPAKVAADCMDYINRAIASGDIKTYEFELPVQDEPRQFEARIVAIGADEVMVIVRDMTANEQAENRLRKLQDELAYVNRLNTLGQMASGLAHELNQPLTAIANYLDAGLQEIHREKVDLDTLRLVMEGGASEATRAGKIIHRLRNLVRPAAAHASSVDLNDLIHEVLALTGPDLRAHGIQLHLHLAESLPFVLVDRIQIGQVILNLIRNALEAMMTMELHRRILTLQTRLLEDVEEGKKVELTVADTGSGLNPSATGHLFEPFFTTKESGMGMGLAISKNIVEGHQGKIWAEPNPVGGMRFCFVLPVSPG